MFRHIASRFSIAGRPLAAGLSVACFAAHQHPRFISSDSPSRTHRKASRRIMIDTDPGVDDALALLLAFGSREELSIEGLTIVFGNGNDIRELGANAKFLLRLAGVEQVPVSLGKAPMQHKCATVSRGGDEPLLVHGADNLGNVSARYGRRDSDFSGFHASAAPEFIYEVCSRSPGEISLVCIGPLTNIAAAIELHPDLPELVREVVVMGGAFGELRGNKSPAAEANFLGDPVAAQKVLTSNFPSIVLAGLDITHQTDVGVLREACSTQGSVISSFVWDVCSNYINVYRYFGESGAPAHDVVPVMYLLRPAIFRGVDVHVQVETAGEITRGMSIADWKQQWGRRPNCKVLTALVDKEGFTQTFVDAMGKLPYDRR